MQQAPPRKRKWDQPVAQPPAGGTTLAGTSDMIAQAQAAALAVTQQYSAVSALITAPRVSHAASAACAALILSCFLLLCAFHAPCMKLPWIPPHATVERNRLLHGPTSLAARGSFSSTSPALAAAVLPSHHLPALLVPALSCPTGKGPKPRSSSTSRCHRAASCCCAGGRIPPGPHIRDIRTPQRLCPRP
jgi:hypothetical protein